MSAASSTSMLDSVALFKDRDFVIGITKEEYTKLKDKGWNTMAKFAYSVNYHPGQADESGLMKLVGFLKGSGAVDPEWDDERVPIIRRLFCEAFTLAASELRHAVEGRASDQPRQLALPERSVRDRDQ